MILRDNPFSHFIYLDYNKRDKEMQRPHQTRRWSVLDHQSDIPVLEVRGPHSYSSNLTPEPGPYEPGRIAQAVDAAALIAP